jgi:uncharacterized membrane protein YfcA
MHLLAFPDLLVALGLGAGLGFFGGIFGIGGGIIAIPVLVLGFGMDQSVAQGTALVMMVPNLLVGWWRYCRRHPVPWRSALGVGLVAAVTTWGVAHFATRLDPRLLKVCFSLFLLLLALRLLIARRATSSTGAPPCVSDRFLPLVGVAGGSSMGLLGIGGGLVATPIFTGWFGLRQTVAQSFSLALVAPSSVVALLTYAGAQRVDWSIGLPLAASGLLTVAAGVGLAHRLPEQRLRTVFAWMLLLTALWLLAGPFIL